MEEQRLNGFKTYLQEVCWRSKFKFQMLIAVTSYFWMSANCGMSHRSKNRSLSNLIPQKTNFCDKLSLSFNSVKFSPVSFLSRPRSEYI